MTKSNTASDKPRHSQNEATHANTEAAQDPSLTPTQPGPADAVSQEARKEALRNARHGDQFVVATDLEDSEQRDAAPGVREQE